MKKEITKYKELDAELKNIDELISLNDDTLLNDINSELHTLETAIDELSTVTLLNQKYDACACYLEIHPGAGGTESCDWADMLKRMYLRFCEKNNFDVTILDEQKGEEAGIKSLTLQITGDYPYGYFKSEKGVHRLVRISPFDSNSRRHTSFASVSVTPLFENTNEIEINEKDLKIDVYHSSGAGGQSVNTSDSAVRVTHLPTKTVVTCQNERSQLKNKEQAMEILKNKLYEKKVLEEEAKIQAIKGPISDINFGSQIRNYVLEPYTLVKDARTGYETSDASSVLDGSILEFMLAYLKGKGKDE